MIAVERAAAEIDAQSEINALVQIVDFRWKKYVSDANIAYGKDRTWLKVQAMWSMLNNANALHEALVNAADAAQAYERDFKHQATKYSAAFLNSWVVKNEQAMETLESDLKEQWGRLQNELRTYAQNEKKKVIERDDWDVTVLQSENSSSRLHLAIVLLLAMCMWRYC